jgi:hypothetical protein
VTLSPAQKLKGPVAVMTGLAGTGLTITSILSAGGEVQPYSSNILREYLPGELTVISRLEAPFDHTYPEALSDLSITLSPEQMVNGPSAVITGLTGVGATFTRTVLLF